MKKTSQNVTTTTSSGKIGQILYVLDASNEQEKLDKFANASVIYYHTSCLSELDYKYVKSRTPKKSSNETTLSDWTAKRSIHSAAFMKIASNVTETLIEKRGVRALSDIYANYTAIFEEEKLKLSADLSESAYKSHHLLKRLMEKFPELKKTVYMNRTYVYMADLSTAEIFAEGFESTGDLKTQIKSIAYRIRQEVMNMETRKLPKRNITLEDILGGECKSPELLTLLIECLIKGPNGSKSERKQKRIECISESIIYSMSNGQIKPATSLYLGLATLSMTGSRRFITILNRMGYCISYTVAEELETELAFGGSEENRTLPNGLVANCPELRTHVAFDNYDLYVETSNGKDTLHDTVGIVFQNTLSSTADVQNISLPYGARNSQNSDPRRRKYQSNFNTTVEPYYKGLRNAYAIVGNSPILPKELEMARKMDDIWMVCNALSIAGTKRWCGWNAERTVDLNSVQKIGYLPNIDMSPTSDAVVKTTLEIAQRIAKDCNQQFIIANYDLAIASKANKIKDDLKTFENVFVNLGAFHIELSYFKVSEMIYSQCKSMIKND